MKRTAIISGITGAAVVLGAIFYATTYQLPNHVPATGRLASGNVMILETSGTPEEYKLYDLRRKVYNGVEDCASYAIIMADVELSRSHGIKVGQSPKTGCKPHHVIVINSSVRRSVTENNPPANSNQWGSCIKIELGASDIVIRNNIIEDCYGEGIDTAEAARVDVIGNTLKNCWSYCIYIDNSTDVLVQGNTASCPDSSFNRNGAPAVSFGVGDENLSKWGGGGVSIAARIIIDWNTSYKCQAPKYWGSQYTNGGVDSLTITNNTAFDTSTRVSVASKPRNSNIVVSGNTYPTSGMPSPATPTATVIQASLTPSKTPTPKPTSTPSAVPTVITFTPVPACEVIYRIPGVVNIQACKE